MDELQSETPPQIDYPDRPSRVSNSSGKSFHQILTGFIIHFTVYVLVNALLMFLDLRNPEDGFWVQWVIGGWGIGIVFHGLGVFLKWKQHRRGKDQL